MDKEDKEQPYQILETNNNLNVTQEPNITTNENNYSEADNQDNLAEFIEGTWKIKESGLINKHSMELDISHV